MNIELLEEGLAYGFNPEIEAFPWRDYTKDGYYYWQADYILELADFTPLEPEDIHDTLEGVANDFNNKNPRIRFKIERKIKKSATLYVNHENPNWKSYHTVNPQEALVDVYDFGISVWKKTGYAVKVRELDGIHYHVSFAQFAKEV